jgi:hypothetical protein
LGRFTIKKKSSTKAVSAGHAELTARAAYAWLLGKPAESLEELLWDLRPGIPAHCCRALCWMQGITEPAARAAYVWVLGEYGQRVQDAPYVLEALAQDFAAEAPEVRLALLTAAAKLFFKRPAECRAALGAALAAGAADASQDVHDRALLYYRWGRGTGCTLHLYYHRVYYRWGFTRGEDGRRAVQCNW